MDSRSLSMLTRRAVGGLRPAGPMLQDFFGFVEGTWNDVDADEFANASCGYGTRFSRGFYRTHITTNQNGNIAVEEIFFSDQHHIGGLQHRIGRLGSSDKTACFDQP